jgi:hypothetical protein
MVHRFRLVALGALAMALLSGCTGGYLVDAGNVEESGGGIAFVGFVIMVVIFAAGLFYMDRIRQKIEDRTEDREDQRQ